MSIEKVVYRARAKATGGRDGRAVSSDNILDVKLAVPHEMGGAGGGTHSEQLFAAGYSACFLGAMKFISNRDKLSMPADASAPLFQRHARQHRCHANGSVGARTPRMTNIMKTIPLSALVALACVVGPVQAQQPAQTQEYSYPSRDGSFSPPSMLRISEQAQSGAPQPAVVRDTPQSVEQYQRCRNNADREAVDRMQLQAMVAACLRELEQRRQP